MLKSNQKLSQESSSGKNPGPEERATHSGWSYFYSSFSKYRDECIALGKNVMGHNLNIAVSSLSEYLSALYSMAQQIFSFYDNKVEDTLTKEWLELGDKVNDFLSKVNDKDFRAQMSLEGEISLDKDLKVSLLKYFNKIDRMAAESGLLVGHESKGATEPKKGLVGYKK